MWHERGANRRRVGNKNTIGTINLEGLATLSSEPTALSARLRGQNILK
jgi:hypothetical protein